MKRLTDDVARSCQLDLDKSLYAVGRRRRIFGFESERIGNYLKLCFLLSGNVTDGEF